MKHFYKKSLVLGLLMFGFSGVAQEILLDADFGTDYDSYTAEWEEGWEAAWLVEEGDPWMPFLDPDFQALGFTGVVIASPSFTTNAEGDPVSVFSYNMLISPFFDLTGYPSSQLTFKIGGYMNPDAAMVYKFYVLTDDSIDFESPVFIGSVAETGSEDITIDLSDYTGQNVRLMWMHAPYETVGLGYLIIDDIVVTGTTTAGITEAVRPKMSVYPNPATDRITVSGLPANTPVSLYTISGQKVGGAVSNGDTEMNISDITPGTYLVATPFGTTKVLKH